MFWQDYLWSQNNESELSFNSSGKIPRFLVTQNVATRLKENFPLEYENYFLINKNEQCEKTLLKVIIISSSNSREASKKSYLGTQKYTLLVLVFRYITCTSKNNIIKLINILILLRLLLLLLLLYHNL